MKFRKRPIEIEAFQLTPKSRASSEDWPDWLKAAWDKDPYTPGAVYPRHFPAFSANDELMVHTLEGNMLVHFDDWIIRGVKGELYPCKPDIFEATYEPVVKHERGEMLKYGTAFRADFLVCPEGHLHVVGRSSTGEAEYELVMGESLQRIIKKEVDRILGPIDGRTFEKRPI